MTERQRKLLLLIEARIRAGVKPTVLELSRASSLTNTVVYDDIDDMRRLDMIKTEKFWRSAADGGYFVIQVSLTPKGEQVVPRVRELV